MSPSISVVCPAWQAAGTLGQTLASVAAQLVPPAEVIVVDDGSSDATAEVARAGGATVIQTTNRGLPAALNTGVAATSGELIAFIDADDLWPADKLLVQLRLLTADPGLAGVLGLVQCFPSPEMTEAESARFKPPDDLSPAWLTGAMLVRRAAFDRVGGFEEKLRLGLSIDWFDRARRLGLAFAIPRRVVLLRRIRANSLSHRSAERDAGYTEAIRRAILRRRSGNPA